MKHVQKILKISAKQAFLQLKKNSPYLCKSLNIQVFVTRQFWSHINFSKYRPQKDLILRLAILPLVEKILEEGLITEKRDWGKYFSYRVTQEFNSEKCSLIILKPKKQENNTLLFSCFVHDNTQKK